MIIIRQISEQQDYVPIWNKMQSFTDNRDDNTPDEIWLVEHSPVFTQGQAGKAEHILAPGDIPVVPVDRGGQVTYHGPGQQMMYVLLNIKRLKKGVRELVTALEQCIVNTLAKDGVEAYAKCDAPGVYVNEQKVCSVGLRIRKGCSFHGLAFNVNMDLEPFQRINPCGYAGMEMTDSTRLGSISNMSEAGLAIVKEFCALMNIENLELTEGFNE